MGKEALQCLLIGEPLEVYTELAHLLNEFNFNIQIKRVNAEKAAITRALKKQRVASLIFISEDVPFSMEQLSDLVWQYSSDTIVTLLTHKANKVLSRPFSNTHFSKLHIDSSNDNSRLYLHYLIQTVELKWEFRRCKRLLGVSEKRCEWLVDSSNEAVAFISRDLHLYANTAYLGLFGFDSINELPAVPVQEMIVSDELGLFQGFMKKQARHHEMSKSLIISLRKRNQRVFRASIHVIPSVFKGKKCFQVWVRPLSLFELKQEQELETTMQKQNTLGTSVNNPFLKPQKVTTASMLRGIIKRKEARISAQSLVEMKLNEGFNKISTAGSHILSLRVPAAQRIGIDNILFNAGGAQLQEKRQIFWDKVKLTRLLQILIKKKPLDINLFVRLSDESATSRKFSEWFLPGLRRIGSKSSKLTFLLPSQINDAQLRDFIRFSNELRSFDCQIALDDFSASKDSLQLLKHLRPEFVRLSLPWVRHIEGDEKRELALASFIRQLESKDIKVIAPCGFSKDMRKLFALSGVSFCQERTLKTV